MKINKEKIKKSIINEGKYIIRDTTRTIIKNKIATNFINRPVFLLGKTVYITLNENNVMSYNKTKGWIIDNSGKKLLKYFPVNNSNSRATLQDGKYRFKYRECLITVIHKSFKERADMHINIMGKNQEDVYKELIKLNERKKDKNQIFVQTCNDNKITREYILKRPKETIFSDQYEYISEIIRKQKYKKEVYEKHFLPFKTGILLYGKPGTGKSSIVKSLATEFPEYLLTIVNLSQLTSKELENCISISNNDKCNNIILLEEIDLGISGNENEESVNISDAKKKISLLLNWLDGMNTPENVIFIATTNYIDKVDERIKRTGRFDYKIEITDICKETAIKMCEYFKADPNKILIKDIEILTEDGIKYSPSKIQELILKSI